MVIYLKFMKLFLFLFLLFPIVSSCAPWVIVANGPKIEAEQLKKKFESCKVIALDGVADSFKDHSLLPDVILGDFDSIEDPDYWGILKTFDQIDENSPPYVGNYCVTIVPAKNQNYTDLEKAIMYCDAKGADSILIVQATGGRMDQTLGNVGLLRKYHRSHRPIIIETEREKICFVYNKEVRVFGGVGDYCAIMGYPEAWMTTSGLAYNGNEYLLQLGMQESICNTLIESESTISIRGEALIILPKSSTFTIAENHRAFQAPRL